MRVHGLWEGRHPLVHRSRYVQRRTTKFSTHIWLFIIMCAAESWNSPCTAGMAGVENAWNGCAYTRRGSTLAINLGTTTWNVKLVSSVQTLPVASVNWPGGQPC